EFNPRRLEEVEERLGLLQTLKRKYGEDIPAILAFAERARKDLDNISNAEERLAELDAEEAQLLEQLGAAAAALSAKRHAAARTLGEAVEAELDDLKMEAARFGVDFAVREDPAGLPLDGKRYA